MSKKISLIKYSIRISILFIIVFASNLVAHHFRGWGYEFIIFTIEALKEEQEKLFQNTREKRDGDFMKVCYYSSKIADNQ